MLNTIEMDYILNRFFLLNKTRAHYYSAKNHKTCFDINTIYFLTSAFQILHVFSTGCVSVRPFHVQND